jgi:hypothetical protein
MADPAAPNASRRTAVVHLVRHANGPEPFEAFMESYRRFDAGLDHELVLLLKGFDDPREVASYAERAADRSPRCIEVSDAGFDLTAYLHTASVLDHDRVCFLNSFSEICAPDWLRLLDGALGDSDNGAAGASGSWASHLSYGLFQLGWRGRYGRTIGSRRAARRLLMEMTGGQSSSAAAYWLLTLVNAVRYLPTLALFPTPHLRTNAFLIDRALLCSLSFGRVGSKRSAHELEGGRGSITGQLRARGRPSVVVDRHGAVWREPDWHEANVFWQADQQDVLVADNQTRMYAGASDEQRALLSRLAWGSRARSR